MACLTIITYFSSEQKKEKTKEISKNRAKTEQNINIRSDK
jgi:hypothetical protein